MALQKIADGNNLYLVVRNGHGFWVVQYRDGQKICSKGLGSAAKLSPAHARRAREEFVVGRRRSNCRSQREQPHRRKMAGQVLRYFLETPLKNSSCNVRAEELKGGVSGAETEGYRRTLVRTRLAKLPIASIRTADVLPC
jgi:Arm domain-containing DNA-binding protein